MDAVLSYFSAHPMVLAAGVFLVVIFILNFIFKSLFKILLVVLAVLAVTVGFFYLTDPEKPPPPVKETVGAIKSGVSDFIDTSKSFYADSKNLFNKGKAARGDVTNLLKQSEEEAGRK